jgi:hypothetical protein
MTHLPDAAEKMHLSATLLGPAAKVPGLPRFGLNALWLAMG